MPAGLTVIYVDSSVILSALLDQEVYPSDAFWDEELISSRLACYEVWNRLHAYQVPASTQENARQLLQTLTLVAFDAAHLERALHPFPLPVKTLDGLHLATMDQIRLAGRELQLATYDLRLARGAKAMGFACWDWDEATA